jgi:hypothetical protein
MTLVGFGIDEGFGTVATLEAALIFREKINISFNSKAISKI